MMQNSLTERITRSLAYMLRHQPEEFDLELDDYGYAEMEDVVCALNERLGEPIREQDVLDSVAGGDRQRYEVVDGRIRALYGHSIPIDAGEPSEPPEFLYIGVSARDAQRAAKHGLQGGRRTFLHLAKTAAEAEETGRRLGGDWTLITVHALEAWEEGVNFFDRKALFLSELIPTDFFEVGPVQAGSGLEVAQGGDNFARGGRGREGRSRDGGRGGGRGGHRGGQRGRDSHDRLPRREEAPRLEPREDRRERSEDAPVREEWVPQRANPRPLVELREPRSQEEPRRFAAESRPNREHRGSTTVHAGERQGDRRTNAAPAVTPGGGQAGSGGSFGLGIFEPPKERNAPAKPTQEVRERPAPPRELRPAPESDAPGGFGAGVL